MADKKIARIVITPGEPAGIGPDITIQVAQLDWPHELIVIADPDLLSARATQIGLPLELVPVDFSKDAEPHQAGRLKIFPVKLNDVCLTGKLNVQNAKYVMACLENAAHFCLSKKADAVVTGPVQKSIMNDAGIAFSGHTEFFAEYCKTPLPIMLFVVDAVKVALTTIHVPLSQVPQAITQEKLISTIRLLHTELKNKFCIEHPQIYVCGLNPHAGENGHLGKEEIETIEPALTLLRSEGLKLIGPLPADTMFTEKYLKKADAILAMYHDQALPVVKYMSFGHAVNVTLGLPIIRTSVDHGTALDLAGTGLADGGSLKAAIKVAVQLL